MNEEKNGSFQSLSLVDGWWVWLIVIGGVKMYLVRTIAGDRFNLFLTGRINWVSIFGKAEG